MTTRGFQDDLAARHAANEREADDLAAKVARQRSDEYREGHAAATDIIGRVATFGGSYEQNTRTLRQAAVDQHSGLAGRVAAGMLAEAAAVNEQNTPDTTAEARRIAALERATYTKAADAEAERMATIRAAREARGRGIDRER